MAAFLEMIVLDSARVGMSIGMSISIRFLLYFMAFQFHLARGTLQLIDVSKWM